jgi:signal peptidase II
MPAKRQVRWLWLSLAILAADRASKFAIEHYTSETFHHVLVPGFITLVHSQNPGIAFGMFADSHSRWLTVLLIAAAAIVIVLLIWLLSTGRAGGRRSDAGVALILGGAAGNLTDRLLHGGVTDFFEVHAGSFHWPAFNLADSAITIGALLVLLDLLLDRRRPATHASDGEA